MNKKYIKFGIAALVALGILFGIYRSNIFGVTEVKTTKLEIGQLADENIYTGVVVPGEIKPIYVSSPAVVEKINVEVGEEISPETALLTFSNQSFIENEKKLKLNELDMRDLELRIADLDSGTMKLELDNKQLDIKDLEEQIKAYQRKLPTLAEEARIAKKKADTYMQLLAKDGVSATEASLMNTTANTKEAEYEDLKTTLELTKQKYQLMYISYESLKRELDINKAKLESELEKLKLQHDTLAKSNEELKNALHSKQAGFISSIDIVEGGTVAPGQRVMSIAIPGQTKVNLEVPVYQAGTLSKGQDATIISREGGSGNKYKGKVDKVSSFAVKSKLGKSTDKVIAVEVLIDGENDLKPGFIADVQVKGNSKKQGLMVNSFSVIEENGDYYVYINDNGKAQKQQIKVGLRDSNGYEILNLPSGTEIIVNPFKVRNGEKIRVVN
ncbi:HlyD family efflux transporter periplasmic adaptor subunit [Fusobacterium hominis]|jgi:HlyD family secretion protein|uniref:HlyD family efflux transporter periplasmic adaptor subunit n=1 Tax=Fusobacterium hominis TaxID=2764326 RepID=A0A7G9GVB7_9FUSO|nr:HlyD family efflux transporter periplasmic adaptor subunit [Fusobacterium hominis]QNM14749.1 HlyD family efflux transporter periplasmic adaptor subunit [Fusobacterium hominis]